MTQTNPHKTLDAQLAAAKAKVREDLTFVMFVFLVVYLKMMTMRGGENESFNDF